MSEFERRLEQIKARLREPRQGRLKSAVENYLWKRRAAKEIRLGEREYREDYDRWLENLKGILSSLQCKDMLSKVRKVSRGTPNTFGVCPDSSVYPRTPIYYGLYFEQEFTREVQSVSGGEHPTSYTREEKRQVRLGVWVVESRPIQGPVKVNIVVGRSIHDDPFLTMNDSQNFAKIQEMIGLRLLDMRP